MARQNGTTNKSEHRSRRDRSDIRELLIDSAMVEFAAHGFEGASTRRIAERADAHQPQINYHFASKRELWQATVEHLFGLLDDEMTAAERLDDPGEALAESIRRLVRFASRHPHLNRMIVQEASSDNERMRWVIEAHVRPRFEQRRQVWRTLLEAGVAAPIPDELMHHVLIGAASMPYVNRPETRLLLDVDQLDDDLVERHAEALVAIFLPGLGAARRATVPVAGAAAGAPGEM